MQLFLQQLLSDLSALPPGLIDGSDDRYADCSDEKERPYHFCSVHNDDSSQEAAMSNREMTVIGLLMQRAKFFFALGVAGPLGLMVLALVVPVWAQHAALYVAMAIVPASFVMMLLVFWQAERARRRFSDRRRQLMTRAA